MDTLRARTVDAGNGNAVPAIETGAAARRNLDRRSPQGMILGEGVPLAGRFSLNCV